MFLSRVFFFFENERHWIEVEDGLLEAKKCNDDESEEVDVAVFFRERGGKEETTGGRRRVLFFFSDVRNED